MIDKLKLVIWDLDETFWKGTLSEGEISLIDKNCEIIRKMTDCGIVNTICSKNDYEDVKNSLNKSDGLWEYFVFASIDWSPKGERIKQLISDMALRAENVLFIDDNKGNLQEALYYNPGLQILEASCIDELYDYVNNCEANDCNHTRLERYKVLEKKCEERKHASSNESFLKDSDIHVYLDEKCSDTNRIAELVARTNQLNYTKLRVSEEEIKSLINNKNNRFGTVYVRDRFGDYGMVGFYCIDINTNKAIQYLFSCRTLGMGIEQWVYQKLKYPEIEVVQPVTVNLVKKEIVTWVKEDLNKEDFINSGKEDYEGLDKDNRQIKRKCRILLKGPCDMFALQPFLGGKVSIETEFNHVNDDGITISSHNHSSHIVESRELSEECIGSMLKKLPFFDKTAFETNIYSDKYDIVFLSLLTDCLQGAYECREDGNIISIGSAACPLTDFEYITKYGTSVNGYLLSEEFLNYFSENFKFLGMINPEKIISNIEYIRKNMPHNTLLVLMLGSEIGYEHDNQSFTGCAQRHKIVNDAVREHFNDRNDVKLINFTEFISGQESFIDCTDHLTKETFYKIATRMTEIINEYSGDDKVKVNKDKSLRYIMSKGFRKLTKILGMNNYQ